MKCAIVNLKPDEYKIKPAADEPLPFGKFFTDRMFSMTFTPEKGWHNAKIEAIHDFSLSPATMVLHYAQEIFEGLKAYPGAKESVRLFRHRANIDRLNLSAERMCMPTVDPDFVETSLMSLLDLERDWIPKQLGASLYIRPTMIGTDALIRLKSSDSFLFYIIMSPVGSYFQTGSEPVKIIVEEERVRSVPGGTGEAKTGGNYAASLLAGKIALTKGYSQVLWLDGVQRRFVEEVGAMNIFFVYGNKVVTPKLTGSILRGITRDSVIQVLKKWNIPVEESLLDINELTRDIENGNLTECFGTGTAAVISPVGTICFQKKDYIINGAIEGSMTQKLFQYLTSIQYGTELDSFKWTTEF